MPVPTPAPTPVRRFDITLPNSIQIPTSLPYGITIPQSIDGITIPSGITLQYTPASLTGGSTTPTSSSDPSPSSTSSAAPSATSSAAAKPHSNTALLAGIFTAVALLLLALLALGAWLCIRRRRRRQRDADLAAAGVIEKGAPASRSWHMRGGGAEAQSTRSVRSASSERLHDTTESEMIFRPSREAGALAAAGAGLGLGAGAAAADKRHLLGRYPSEAMTTPGSPLSFDRVTHPDGSYFPTAYSPGPRAGAGAGVYGAAAAAGLAGRGAHARRASDPFADDPRAARASESLSDLGAPVGRRAEDDPSYVFGESFLGRAPLGREPTAGGTFPPLLAPAPALAHANSRAYASSSSGSGSSHVPASVASSTGSGWGAPAHAPAAAGSDTGLWLAGRTAHEPAPSDTSSSEESYDVFDLGNGSTQAAAAAARRPAFGSGGGSNLASIPERANSDQSVYMTPEANTPAAVQDRGDYQPARRLSVINHTP